MKPPSIKRLAAIRNLTASDACALATRHEDRLSDLDRFLVHTLIDKACDIDEDRSEAHQHVADGFTTAALAILAHSGVPLERAEEELG